VLQCVAVCCSVLHSLTFCPLTPWTRNAIRMSGVNESHPTGHLTQHCNTLQHAVSHCISLQHTATNYNTPKHAARHCHTPQHAATHCYTLQHAETHMNDHAQYDFTVTTLTQCHVYERVTDTLQHTRTQSPAMSHVCMSHVTRCNTLQCVVTRCNTRQHTVTHFNTLSCHVTRMDESCRTLEWDESRHTLE